VHALELLSGDAQAFLDKVWASRVHLHHAAPAALAGILSLDDVDRLLTASGLRTPALRVVKDGSICPASSFTRAATIAGSPLTGLVDARRALAMYDDGATLVLQGLHRYWPRLTELVRGLELELGHPCQANAYLTPPGSQGFARHSDTHDVFVFQTHGSKQWHVIDDGQERDVVLEPGLSMYLPTGTPHSARSQDQASLHVTIGINRLTWRDVLRRQLTRLLADERYDAALPAGFLDEPDRLAEASADRLDALRGQLATLTGDRLAGAVIEDFLTDRPPVLAGGLRDRALLAALDDRTVLERRPTAACVLRTDDPDGRLRVLLGDRELRMPARLAGPMAVVRDRHRFRVADLGPGLDAAGRQVLARRLVREGLLRIAR
jgi:mannose-6-phosphate isomerase-like protein (cupin superfamily)